MSRFSPDSSLRTEFDEPTSLALDQIFRDGAVALRDRDVSMPENYLWRGKCLVYLSPPGRGATLTHGFHAPDELEQARSTGGAIQVSTPEPSPPRANALSALESKLNEALAEIAELKDRVTKLEAR